MTNRRLCLLAVCALLAGCQTGGPTWSEVTGERYHRAVMNRMPTVIETIDGSSLAASGPLPYRMDPGRHVLVLQGVPQRAYLASTRKEFAFQAEPCKRYYVNAQFEGQLVPSAWEPVIDYVEPIGSCRPPGTP